jgi:hypothetical protein
VAGEQEPEEQTAHQHEHRGGGEAHADDRLVGPVRAGGTEVGVREVRREDEHHRETAGGVEAGHA